MGFLSSIFSLNALPYAVSFWVIMIVGNVLPFYSEQSVPLGVNTVIAAVFLGPLLLKSEGSAFSKLAILMLYVFLVLLVFGMLRTDDPAYAMLKIDGAIIVPFFTSFIAVECIRKHGASETCKAMCAVLFAILVATVLYKLHFGFFDRTVRFFLNGPIVFSWLMGVLAILSLHLGISTNSKIYFLVFALAFLAVIWSMSKGPLLALTATLVFYFLRNITNKRASAALFVVASVVCVTVYFIKDALLSSRYMAIFRVSQGDDVDEGSVGARMGMWTDSIELAHDHPLIGVGLANWQFYTDTDFFYPHNFVLELASEMGIIFTFLAFMVIVTTSWKIRQSIFFSVVVFLFICLLFSGDVTYLRYPLAFLIMGYCATKLRPGLEPNLQERSA